MGWPWSLWLHACMQLWVPTTLNPELSLTSTLHHESLIESFFFLVQHSYIFFLVKTKLYILTEYDLLYFVYIILTMDFEECTSSTFFFFWRSTSSTCYIKMSFHHVHAPICVPASRPWARTTLIFLRGLFLLSQYISLFIFLMLLGDHIPYIYIYLN